MKGLIDLSQNGGQAFPGKVCVGHTTGDEVPVYEHPLGMSLLDWFAGQATNEDVQSLGGETAEQVAKYLGIEKYDYHEHHHLLRSKARYDFAEAMVAERNRRAPNNS